MGDKVSVVNVHGDGDTAAALLFCFHCFCFCCRRFELERPGVGPCSRGADLGKGGNLFFNFFFFYPSVSSSVKLCDVTRTHC